MKWVVALYGEDLDLSIEEIIIEAETETEAHIISNSIALEKGAQYVTFYEYDGLE